MAKAAPIISDKAIKSFTPSIDQRWSITRAVGVIDGLYIQISPKGNKSWLLRYTEPGTGRNGSKQVRREIGLGRYPDVSLADARSMAFELRRKIQCNIDPLLEKRAQYQALATERDQSLTFIEAAKLWLNIKFTQWNSKDALYYPRRFEEYFYPRFGSIRLSEITTLDIVEALKPVWITRLETAKKVRIQIDNLFTWAIAAKHLNIANPTPSKKHMDIVTESPSNGVKNHFPALPVSKIQGFMADLVRHEEVTALALRFIILNASRTGEAVESRWEEYDLDSGIWTIPAERMKAKRLHRVPLSSEALKILRTVPRIEGNPYVFVGRNRGRPLSKDNSTLKFLKETMGYSDLTVHGFRSTFRDWAAEHSNYPNEVIEMALAHAIGNKAEAAYRRGDLLEKRRALMQDWADFCIAK